MLKLNCPKEHMPMSTFLNASPIFGPSAAVAWAFRSVST